jgi:hypothetical protein
MRGEQDRERAVSQLALVSTHVVKEMSGGDSVLAQMAQTPCHWCAQRLHQGSVLLSALAGVPHYGGGCGGQGGTLEDAGVG